MYTTTDEVKRYLGLTDDRDDAIIARFIERAQSAIDSVCGRTFEATADTTHYFDALADVSGQLLILDDDLCKITSIVNGDGTTVSTNQYVTEPRGSAPYWAIRLKSSSNLVWTYADDPENAIAVTGRWAYSITAPMAIQHLCVVAAAAFYRQRESQNPIGEALVLEGGVRVATPKDVVQYLATQCGALGYIRL